MILGSKKGEREGKAWSVPRPARPERSSGHVMGRSQHGEGRCRWNDLAEQWRMVELDGTGLGRKNTEHER